MGQAGHPYPEIRYRKRRFHCRSTHVCHDSRLVNQCETLSLDLFDPFQGSETDFAHDADKFLHVGQAGRRRCGDCVETALQPLFAHRLPNNIFAVEKRLNRPSRKRRDSAPTGYKLKNSHR